MDSFVLSPLRSVLSDNSDIELSDNTVQRCWWKKLEENTGDVMAVLENKQTDQDVNVENYIDAHILRQEKKYFSVDLPATSDAESVSSIVIPQRKLFAQKDSQTVKFEQIMVNRESLAQLHRSKINYDKTINDRKKDSFNRSAKEPSKPVFPAKIANQGQSRKLIGNRAGAKRKNIFTEFFVSESEDEISIIKQKFFGSSKNNKHQKQKNSAPRKLRKCSRSSEPNEMASFLPKGRNTSVRKTKIIIKPQINFKPSLAKERSKPVFPAKIANQGQARKLTEFIISESEDEISIIKQKFFGSSKNNKHQQRKNSTPREFRETTSDDISDMDMDEWKLLPSSTMVDIQLDNIEECTTSEKMDKGEIDLAKNVVVQKHTRSNDNNSSKNFSFESPEYALHHVPNKMASFSPNGSNTSIRKTKSVIKSQINSNASLEPLTESTGSSDEGSKNSSAETSDWDFHTARKTLRQTSGKDFSPMKSLRTLVREKSAKRRTYGHDMTFKVPQACCSKFHENMDVYISEDDGNGERNGINEEINEDIPQQSSDMPNDTTDESDDPICPMTQAQLTNEISTTRRQADLLKFFQKTKEENMEEIRHVEEAVENSLKATRNESCDRFQTPARPNAALRRINMKTGQTKSKVKRVKSTLIPIENLPAEVLEDMKYKPTRRYQLCNASWATQRLYKFLEAKLEPKYDYKARVRAEKLVKTIYNFTKYTRRHKVAPTDAVNVLKLEMAKLKIVKTHHEFYDFFDEFMPRKIRIKVVPDLVNQIPFPEHGPFSDIIRKNE
ncbi:unnamed protein product [Parnassius apollo]|uniref:(apollo) hypothetical protein n=1 Tax=Parnassius apollo TaxID=110799 RepID=A0A8S3XMN5_PARAO|nr:unnamed protein product [Parnassius apollo]